MTTAQTDLDNRSSLRNPIAIKVMSVTVSTAVSSASWTTTAELNGEIVALDYHVASFIGPYGEGVTVRVLDEDGNQLHRKTNLSQGAVAKEQLRVGVAPFRVPLVGTISFAVTTQAITTLDEAVVQIVAYLK